MATMDEMKDHSHVIDTEINSPIASDVESVEAAGSRESFLSTFTPEEDKAIMRKVDRRFLLLIGILYLTKNFDYSNAANVKVLQVGQPRNVLNELHMTSNQYNWVQSIYFISYIIFEAPSSLLQKRMTPHIFQTRILLSWGIVLACHAAIKNKESYYALRFLLGMMEAGMFPGIASLLCSWYRSDEMGKPIMWMFGLQNCSGIVGSLLCYGISYMNGLAGLSAWRWVYLLEGLYTICLSVVVFLVLPDYPKSPRSRKWLTPREQEYISVRLSENAPQTEESAFSKKEIYSSLFDKRTYAFMACQMLVNIGGYGLSWYLPTIVTDLGFASLPRNQLLNIPPAAASVLAIIFAGWFLERAYLTRGAFVQPIFLGMTICFVLMGTITNKVGIYICCTFGTMFYAMYFIPLWPWRAATLKGMTGTTFTLAFQSSVGQIGGAVGPQLWQSKYAYNGYKTPFAVCAAFIVAAWIANVYTWWLTRNVEADVKRIRRLRIKAKKEGYVFSADDIKVFEERGFYSGLHKRSEV